MFSKWTSSISLICEDVNNNRQLKLLSEELSSEGSGSIIRRLRAIDPTFLSRWRATNIKATETPVGFSFENNIGRIVIGKCEEDSTKYDIAFFNSKNLGTLPDVVKGVFIEDVIRTIDTKFL